MERKFTSSSVDWIDHDDTTVMNIAQYNTTEKTNVDVQDVRVLSKSLMMYKIGMCRILQLVCTKGSKYLVKGDTDCVTLLLGRVCDKPGMEIITFLFVIQSSLFQNITLLCF